jgi:hypothetical protein
VRGTGQTGVTWASRDEQHPQVNTSKTKPLLTVKFRQPSHEFTFGVGITFIPYPLVVTPVVEQVHLCMSVLEFSVYAGF